jgi:hypothetical protein
MAEHVAKKTKEKLHLNQLLTVGKITALTDMKKYRQSPNKQTYRKGSGL